MAYWRMGTSSDSQNDEADGRSSQSQVSITTRKEHLEVDPVRGNKPPARALSGKEKKQFLKKGSRKFLACTGDAYTHRDKENASIATPQVPKSKSISKQVNGSREKRLPNSKRSEPRTPQKEYQQQQCPISIKPQLNVVRQVECVPPELLISRLTGTEVSQQQTPSAIRTVFSDGRITLYFKQIEVSEQYLGSTTLTQWPNGDWKLQHNGSSIYRLDHLNRYQVNGRLV